MNSNGQGRLAHIGMTVESIERTYEFYHKYFGFELLFTDLFDENYINSANYIFHVPEHTVCRFGFMQDAHGTAIELFEFNNKLPFELPPWNKPGFHHLCIEVEDVQKQYAWMRADGITFCEEPRPRQRKVNGKTKYLVFLQDPDGNYLELH